MVGIAIVTHNAQLAEAVHALTKQMLRQEVPLAAVGGVDDPENPFGTDATQIHEAIKSVYSSDGVVVLMDIGSALLSAEASLEWLTEKQRARVCLCEAPLVEGPIAAAVRSEAEWQRLQAAIGAVQREIRAMRTRISVNAGDYEAVIFDAHLLFLEDPALLEAARRGIFEQKDNAETSWQQAIDGMIESYQAIEDPYIRSRGADLADLKMQVLRLLAGSTSASF